MLKSRAATGFYKSTILRLAGSLERSGYLVRAENGVFRLGPAVWRLGSIYRAGFVLGEAVRPQLRRLVEATGETASFYVREGATRVCLFRQNSPHAARHHLDEGSALPLTAGASAHVLLAFSDGKGARTKAVRERGYDISLGERDPQVAAVAVPVFDLAGKFRGALAVSGLIGRLHGEGAPRRRDGTFPGRRPPAENNTGQRRIAAEPPRLRRCCNEIEARR